MMGKTLITQSHHAAAPPSTRLIDSAAIYAGYRGSTPPPIMPLIGGNDVVPPGFRAPGMGGGGFPGMPRPGMGGGMHMGPDDPMFAGRMQQQQQPRRGMVPPGARWDPIRPPGMEVRRSLRWIDLSWTRLKHCVSCTLCCHHDALSQVLMIG